MVYFGSMVVSLEILHLLEIIHSCLNEDNLIELIFIVYIFEFNLGMNDVN